MDGRKAVFLDRDGTINVEVHYLHEPEKFRFEVGVVDALRSLKEAGYLLIVVTNQGGIAKGLYKVEDVEATHSHMIYLLKEEGIELDDIFYCPHSPNGLEETGLRKECECRKPNPGMILKGIEKYHLDPAMSWMIGDKLSDIEAGNRAGVHTILVRTGYGAEEECKLRDILNKAESTGNASNRYIIPEFIVSNLGEAVAIILQGSLRG